MWNFVNQVQKPIHCHQIVTYVMVVSVAKFVTISINKDFKILLSIVKSVHLSNPTIQKKKPKRKHYVRELNPIFFGFNETNISNITELL